MVQPARRRWPVTAIVDIILLVGGVALAIYFLVDDTISAWLIRLSWAGAIVAGVAAVLYAAARLVDRENRGPYV